MTQYFVKGWLTGVTHLPSPFFNQRPSKEISLLVIHSISLPEGKYGLSFIDDLFLGKLNDEYCKDFETLKGLEVSAHFLIRRNGDIIQYVSCDDRAWHAGVSEFSERIGCNDFSIGIELEGCDHDSFEHNQYASLIRLSQKIMKTYPEITPDRIVGHCHIAPERKTDPGPYFDWQYFLSALS